MAYIEQGDSFIEMDIIEHNENLENHRIQWNNYRTAYGPVLRYLQRPVCSKWCFIVSIVLALVCVTSIVIFTEGQASNTIPQYTSPPTTPSIPTTTPGWLYTREIFLTGDLSPIPFMGVFITGHEFYYHGHGLEIYNCKEERSISFNEFEESKNLKATDFQFSNGSQSRYFLYALYETKNYRYSYNAQYRVYDKKTNTYYNITNYHLQLAVMCPQTTGIAYSHMGNIYYRPRPDAPESEDIQLTVDGYTGWICNGIPDWVNEEEILQSNKAMWFSKNGTYIAYIKYNDTDVNIDKIPVYGPAEVPFQYPLYTEMRYPKPGRPNPIATVHVTNVLSSKKGQPISVNTYHPPGEMENRMEAIPTAVVWANDEEFLIVWMNRFQNNVIMQMCRETSHSCRTVLNHMERNGWIQMEPPIFDKNGERMVFIWWNEQSNGDSYPHVTLLNRTEFRPKLLPLTKGIFSVKEISGWHQESDEVIFMATVEGAPEQTVVSKVQAHSPYKVTCLSCLHTHTSETDCTYNSCNVSPTGEFIALNCAGPKVPEVNLISVNGTKIKIWQDGSDTRIYTDRLPMPVTQTIHLKLQNNFSATVQFILPKEYPNLKAINNSHKKFPLLVDVYAGPDTTRVTDKYHPDFNNYLVANRSIVSVSIDARGSSSLGQKNRFAVYKNLGKYEAPDQLAVIRYLHKTFPFIDSTKIAVWGWSYGGYVTGMILAEDFENEIKCGIAVAPVTDFIFYDSMYTERYMQTPQLNPDGYQKSSLVKRAINIRDNKLLIIHGTKDDNVHYQNTLQLVKQLEKENILFDQITYTDLAHDLQEGRHLYRAMEEYLMQCFAK